MADSNLYLEPSSFSETNVSYDIVQSVPSLTVTTKYGDGHMSSSDADISCIFDVVDMMIDDKIAPLETKTDITNKDVANIQALLNGTLYREETDSTEAYSKAVPSSAMPWASVDMIGGKTVAWNQLMPAKTSGSTTQNGLTITWGADGSLSVSGTASALTDVVLVAASTLAAQSWHKVFFSAPAGGSADTYMVYNTYLGVKLYDTTIVSYGGAPGWVSGSWTFRVISGAAVNIKFTPVMCDLTLMFGAGNEPATVAEFEAMFPTIDPAYNAGELRSAGVTEAVSEGRNILNPALLTSCTYDNSTGKWDTTTVAGYNYSFFVRANGSDRSLNVTSLLPVKPNTAYTVSFVGLVGVDIPSSAQTLVSVACYNSNSASTYISSHSINYGQQSVSFVTDANVDYIDIRRAHNSGHLQFSAIQVEEGSTATAYTPYRSPISYPVPAAIQALPGYGWSARTVYNYVDYARKVYVQRVGKIVLDGTQPLTYVNWNPSENGVGWLYPYSLTQAKPVGDHVVGNIVSDKYLPVNYYNLFGMTKVGIGIYYTTAYGIVIRQPDTSLTTVSAINAYLAANPITVYYELATPVETDISGLLSDDNLIEVEPGGSLTFENQNGDDWRVPVPNSETYIIDIQEAVSNG